MTTTEQERLAYITNDPSTVLLQRLDDAERELAEMEDPEDVARKAYDLGFDAGRDADVVAELISLRAKIQRVSEVLRTVSLDITSKRAATVDGRRDIASYALSGARGAK